MKSRGSSRSPTASPQPEPCFIASQSFIPASVSASEEKRQPHVVFMISEPEYETGMTLPAFVERNLAPHGLRCSMVFGDAVQPDVFPEIEALKTADLLVLSVCRRALPAEQPASFGSISRPASRWSASAPRARLSTRGKARRRAGRVARISFPRCSAAITRARRQWSGDGRADRLMSTTASHCRRSAATASRIMDRFIESARGCDGQRAAHRLNPGGNERSRSPGPIPSTAVVSSTRRSATRMTSRNPSSINCCSTPSSGQSPSPHPGRLPVVPRPAIPLCRAGVTNSRNNHRPPRVCLVGE